MANITDVLVPDIGGATNVDVIDVLVKPGDQVNVEDALITLETEKASMDVPSPFTGTVKELKLKVGDKAEEGSLILTMEAEGAPETKAEEKPTVAEKPAAAKPAPEPAPVPAGDVHAGPAVRRLARELDINLNQVRGTGSKGRITKEDLKAALGGGGSGMGLAVAPAPAIDFSKFGEVEIQPLNKIKRFAGKNVHRSWVTVPHVTQFAEADITEMEAFRKTQKASAEAQGLKLTPLVFIMKAVISSLKAYPQFNASLDASGENLVLKKYFNLGVAVDTPNGLVVPVVRDVDKKGFFDLAKELGAISTKARDKGLMPQDMQGSCFTISSLGGIGGTAFTPIVNTPDVAILGLSRSSMKPVYQDGQFVPRLMLPLSLSYDHRVIDGADGARFVMYLAQRLADIRTLLL